MDLHTRILRHLVDTELTARHGDIRPYLKGCGDSLDEIAVALNDLNSAELVTDLDQDHAYRWAMGASDGNGGTLGIDDFNVRLRITQEGVMRLRQIEQYEATRPAVNKHPELIPVTKGTAINTISEVTRRNIFDVYLREFNWAGRIRVTDFLSRLYDLKNMASLSNSHASAFDEIFEHQDVRSDWAHDWVLTDPRFDVLNSLDTTFLKFVCESLHPAVQESLEAVDYMTRTFNGVLAADGWRLVQQSEISGRPIFTYQRIDEGTSVKAKRFKVALSFPGERRDFVFGVAEKLAAKIGRNAVLYDNYYEPEFARPDLDTYLQDLYHNQSDLIAVFICAAYERKEWPGLEWRVIKDLIKKRKRESIMFLRFDETSIPGLLSIDGSVWIGNRSPDEIAEVILARYEHSYPNLRELSHTASSVVKAQAVDGARDVVVRSVAEPTTFRPHDGAPVYSLRDILPRSTDARKKQLKVDSSISFNDDSPTRVVEVQSRGYGVKWIRFRLHFHSKSGTLLLKLSASDARSTEPWIAEDNNVLLVIRRFREGKSVYLELLRSGASLHSSIIVDTYVSGGPITVDLGVAKRDVAVFIDSSYVFSTYINPGCRNRLALTVQGDPGFSASLTEVKAFDYP